ncbi:MFS transporter [Alicyclobacillus fastidiosus]|uniref:MFS transporter n=1 Tax=Alicyclobacillus fastidiosus TaxID=392011 RepID=A0ABV5ABC5_9BACL|nr:MFS transporter [Alicyclobacillus fastidiosus]WEH10842.1 MFS transporter [Alicyclobacillus fastidiosus]
MIALQANKKLDLVSLASIPLIMTLGNSMLIPVLPEMERQLKIGSLQVSMIITVYSVVAIFLIPVAGYMSDQYGRKKIIIPSLVITGIGGLMSGLAAWFLKDSYWVILLGRLLQGIGAAGAFPIVLPLVGDMFKSDDDVSQGLGIIETANTFGKVLSPILGAALAMVVWYLPFLSIPVFCTLSVVLVSWLVKVPRKADQKKVKFRAFLSSMKEIFAQKGRWLIAIFTIGGISMFVIFGSMFYLSSQLEDDFHIKGITKGLILAIPLLALCITSFITGKNIQDNKRRMKWLSFTGCVIQTAAITAGATVNNIYLLLSALVLGGAGIGLVLPCLDALITGGIDKKERGTVTSLYSSVRYIGVAAGPPAVSLLSKLSHQAVFYSISGLCAVSAILSLFAIKPGTNAQKPGNAEHFDPIGPGRGQNKSTKPGPA